MADNGTTTGATPGAGATPGQAGQQQPTTPPPADATPTAGTNADPAADPPATGEGTLGDAGKQAIDRMKAERNAAIDRAKAAEEERDALRAETQTEQEKAIETARKEAVTEADTKWATVVRRSQVERALTAAGISQSELGLAAAAPDFASLELGDEGQVEDLDKAVNAFKDSHSALFTAPARPTGSIDAGARGTASVGEQAAAALADGDIKTSIALKNRQLMERATS